MKKSNKEIAEFYGIEVGDTVKIFDHFGELYGEFLVKDLEATCPLQVIKCREKYVCAVNLTYIGTQHYEVIKPKKKYGDLKCKDLCCRECPLRSFTCTNNVAGNTLYGVLEESWLANEYAGGTNNPIYKAYKAELDKEVEE